MTKASLVFRGQSTTPHVYARREKHAICETQAFGLPAATTFSDVTAPNSTTATTTSSSGTAASNHEALATLLSSAYGGEIEDLDAITGALAEFPLSSSGGVFGPLLHAAWEAQMYR